MISITVYPWLSLTGSFETDLHYWREDGFFFRLQNTIVHARSAQMAALQLNCIKWQKRTLQPRQRIVLTNAVLLRFVIIVTMIGKTGRFIFTKDRCRRLVSS